MESDGAKAAASCRIPHTATKLNTTVAEADEAIGKQGHTA